MPEAKKIDFKYKIIVIVSIIFLISGIYEYEAGLRGCDWGYFQTVSDVLWMVVWGIILVFIGLVLLLTIKYSNKLYLGMVYCTVISVYTVRNTFYLSSLLKEGLDWQVQQESGYTVLTSPPLVDGIRAIIPINYAIFIIFTVIAFILLVWHFMKTKSINRLEE
jgi:hypothetical protein